MAQRATATAPRPAARRRRAPSPAQIDFYFPQQVDNSRLVKYADPGERRSQNHMVLVSLAVVALLLLSAYPRFALTRTGYAIEELKLQRESLLETNRKLRLEEATLRDPGRIDAIARNQLGMVPAAAGQVIALDASGAETNGTVLARVQPPSRALKPLLAATQ